MTRRRTLTAAQAREILIRQAFAFGSPIPCALCREGLIPGQAFIREHLHALGIGGSDDIENSAFVHAECANRKTRGAGGTTAGSDVQRIAKMKRLAGETGQGRRKARIPSRPFQKGHRPLRG